MKQTIHLLKARAIDRCHQCQIKGGLGCGWNCGNPRTVFDTRAQCLANCKGRCFLTLCQHHSFITKIYSITNAAFEKPFNHQKK